MFCVGFLILGAIEAAVFWHLMPDFAKAALHGVGFFICAAFAALELG